MDTLKDVLLYLARHVPAAAQDLAAMERVLHEHFGEDQAQQPSQVTSRLLEGLPED